MILPMSPIMAYDVTEPVFFHNLVTSFVVHNETMLVPHFDTLFVCVCGHLCEVKCLE